MPRLIGTWKGDKPEATREGPRSSTITQTYALDDKGRSLVVKTKVEGGRSFEFKRVYRKAA